ncbi:family 78 glycoside hydrolase catalytic domain [Psychrosphaera sp. 1_MG-2023]|uniref:alpha-L-rhamnosidase n=1 Tax=Psychrosphaera sp. 1_MG-2023 TaxID=3062643 RepID=UPI0026E3AE8D|nr:alpha-L-rhamnosidase [Psychrosphaera sp. 1_MG-2023]MDO6719825.1 family 78 glycoside hydrolase catalytic domain [Psychrosphaera sp. 1_MG-2023]
MKYSPEVRVVGFRTLLLCLVSTLLLSSCSLFQSVSKGSAPNKLSIGTGQTHLLGHFESKPRFSWKIDEDSTAKQQSAYQIQVSDNQKNIAQANLWDSGKINSNKNSWVDYNGRPLSSRQVVFWRVRIWDEHNQVSEWSKQQRFELGLLSNQDWQASWIGHPATRLSKNPSQSLLATPQYLRRTFIATDKPIKARLYVTAKGLFKAYVNGQEVAPNDVMTPGWTPYQKRIETLTYDVTKMLASGGNVIAAKVASGWYSGRVYKFTEKEFLKPSRFLAQLEIEYANGSKQLIATDQDWKASISGPIEFASIYDGERYNQNLEDKSWHKQGFSAENWDGVVSEALDHNIELSPKQHAPIRIVESLQAAQIVSNQNGTVIFDFGQNMVGVPKIRVPVVANQQLRMRFAEALHKGEFYTDNYRSAESTNYYHPKQSGYIEYQPSFTYHGYRYVELTGYDKKIKPDLSWVTALVQHSDVEITANFTSSAPKLNKLAENIVWGLRSNFYDIPLDCPQRDERLGWTGDAQVFVTPSMYMADVYGFWSAWLKSIREEQGEDGKIPLYIPFVEWINFASSGWGDASTIIPWELYMVTGDQSILADNYQMMKGWVNYHQKKSKNNISNMMTFGDWLQPYPVLIKEGDKGNRGNTDFSLIGTAYYARSLELTLKAAKVLNYSHDVAQLMTRYNDVKKSFLSHFFDQNLNLKQGIATQTTYLLGLAYNLFPDDKIALAEDKLVKLIEEADDHLRTGFLGTPLLASVLQKAGRSDLVYDLIFKETYPSWFYSINNGATTTWERWNSYSIEDGFNPEGMNSLNHYAYGSISRWFYEGMLGIKPITPGFSHFEVAPQFNLKLSSASGSLATPNGEINVSWKVAGKKLELKVVVPKNTRANIVLPELKNNVLILNGEKGMGTELVNLKAGEYVISATLFHIE